MDAFAACASAGSLEALVAALQTAIQDGVTWYFSRFLSLPSVQQLRGSTHDGLWQALRLLAFGTWRDYQAALASGAVAELPPPAAAKLKVLTLLSLSLTRASPLTVSFDELCTAVGESDSIVAERLIHAAVDAGLLEAVIDHRAGSVRLSGTQGRDVAPTPEGLAPLLGQLDAWQAQLGEVQSVLASLRAAAAAGSTPSAAAQSEEGTAAASSSSSSSQPSQATPEASAAGASALEQLTALTKAVIEEAAKVAPPPPPRQRDRGSDLLPDYPGRGGFGRGAGGGIMDSEEEADLSAGVASVGPSAGSRRGRGVDGNGGGSRWGRGDRGFNGAEGEEELPMKRRTGDDRRPLPRPVRGLDGEGGAASLSSSAAVFAPPPSRRMDDVDDLANLGAAEEDDEDSEDLFSPTSDSKRRA